MSALVPGAATHAAPFPSDRETTLGGTLLGMFDRIQPCIVQVVARRPSGPCPKALQEGGLDRRDVPVTMTTLWATGLVVDGEGRVLTCVDAAQPNDSLLVQLLNGEERRAVFVSQEPRLGVSMIRVLDTHGLVSALDARALRPLRDGDWLLLFGYRGSDGLPDLRLGRLEGTSGAVGSAASGEAGWLRVSVPTTPGACGAAVLDGNGSFRGLVTEADVEQDGAPLRGGCPAGIAGSLSADHLRAAGRGSLLATYDRMRELELRPRGFLGVQVVLADTSYANATASRQDSAPPESDFAPRLLKSPLTEARTATPVVVEQVLPGSPAEVAGLMRGDQIVTVNGRPVVQVEQVTDHVAALAPGTWVRMDVLRQGAPFTLSVRVGDRSSLEWMARLLQRSATQRKRLLKSMADQQAYLALLDQLQASFR